MSLLTGIGLLCSITLFNDYQSGASLLFQGGIANYLKMTLFFNVPFEVVSFLIFMQVAELNPQQFYRINRSVILNLNFVKTYTFLKTDKCIVKLGDRKTEFVIQSARGSELKKRLHENAPTV